MNTPTETANKLYWRLLTPLGKILSGLQLLLLGARLLLPVHGSVLDSPAWFAAQHGNDLRISALGVEVALLLFFLIQWCAWSELIYSLRLEFRPSQTSRNSRKGRRFALHIYGGFIFLIVLSGLATLQPLLGIGAMFLLFMSTEAQDRSLEQKPMPVALLWGMLRSYKMISREPWEFLGLLLLPGVVLYGYGALLVSLGVTVSFEASGVLGLLVTVFLLILWLWFFLLAQLRVALRGVPLDQASSSFNQPLGPFNRLCNVLAGVLSLGIGGWLLFRLGDGGLLSLYALALAFGQVVTVFSTTVTAFLSLVVKAGFIAIVVGFVTALLMLMIGLGRGEPLKQLHAIAVYLQRGLRALSGKIEPLDLNLQKGASLGLGTLLTALGTVAVQTYERVQKDQERQTIAQEAWQRQQTKQEEDIKTRVGRNEELVARIQQRIVEQRKEKDQVQMQLRNQLLTELRDVLPELKLLNGEVDGDRKGRILRYLYESDLLQASGNCGEVITSKLRGKPATEAKAEIEKLAEAKLEKEIKDKARLEKKTEAQARLEKENEKCKLGVYLHEMDFSGASLKGAYLNNAFLPLIDLRNADLRDARLKGAKLNLANLENSDLEGADLTETDLSGSILVGANLSEITVENGGLPKINGAIAFYAVHTPTKKEQASAPKKAYKVVSWDLTKGSLPGQLLSSPWTFCPVDSESNQLSLKQIIDEGNGLFSQGGSKCRNRRFDSQSKESALIGKNDSSSEYLKRDWSGSSFKKSSLKGMTFERVKLDGADLSGAILEDMNLKNVSFAGANLQDAVFRESALENVDFTGANLKGFRLERMRRLTNLNYLGSVIDLDDNPTFTKYGKNRLRNQVYDHKLFSNRTPNELATFRQKVFAPLVMTVLPLRPQQLLYWMMSYPQPSAYLPRDGER